MRVFKGTYNRTDYIKITVLTLVLVFASFQRIQLFDQIGKDVYAFEKAISDLLGGVNPYIWAIESFSNPDDPGNHGYAYLPGLLYVESFLYTLSLLSGIPFQILWKIPVLLADLGVGILLIKNLYRKSYLALVFALLFWFVNPYFYFKNNYVFTDPITIFFMLLALYKLEKDDVLSGAFYALSIIFKLFPIILFPLFLIKANDRKRFLLSGFIVAIAVSIPFMRSVSDFTTYLNGALFVHGDRFIQGRPFLFYISYFYDIELFQIIPFRVYTLLATFGGWLLILIFYFLGKRKDIAILKDKYFLSLLSFANFYLFTPVLNRTYLIWFLPIFAIAAFSFFRERRVLFYVVLIAFWLFYYWYLAQWKDGFHIWRPL